VLRLHLSSSAYGECVLPDEKLIRLNRKPAAHWTKLHHGATWATHFNNIRLLATERTPAAWELVLARELKLLCLFHDRTVVIPDSDAINNPAFQALFRGNFHRIRSAFSQGPLMLALRDTAGGLCEVNDQQGSGRLNPEMETLARPFARDFDQFFRAEDLVALEWQMATGVNRFAALIRRLIEFKESPLSPSERELLGAAVQAAVSADSAGRLLFFNVYDHLVSKQRHEFRHPCIQALRAAYMLNISMSAGISPSVSMTDLDPSYAFFIATGKSSVAGTVPDELALHCPIPERILLDSALDTIMFDRIPTLQQLGESLGYFDALEKARASVGAPEFGDSYIRYLDKLAKYMRALEKDSRSGPRCSRFELVDWQKEVLRDRVDAISAREHDLKVLLAYTPPVLIGSTVVPLICMNILPLAALGAAAVGWNVLTGVGSSLVARAAELERARLKRLIDGSTTVPATNL
jgi:hypothetical protein